MPDINAVYTPAQRAQAKSLIEDPAFNDARDRLQAAYYRLWQKAKTVEERERLHSMATVLHDVCGELVHCRDHNKVDEARIELAAAKAKTK